MSVTPTKARSARRQGSTVVSQGLEPAPAHRKQLMVMRTDYNDNSSRRTIATEIIVVNHLHSFSC